MAKYYVGWTTVFGHGEVEITSADSKQAALDAVRAKYNYLKDVYFVLTEYEWDHAAMFASFNRAGMEGLR